MGDFVAIYTDGACSGNPGPGGWAVLFIKHDVARYISGYHPFTTNNQMELTGAIQALKTLRWPTKVDLYTDSRYVCDGINVWVHSWQKNDWRNAKKKTVLNPELWQELLQVAKKHEVRWHWVRGHSDDKLNNFVDWLARDAIQKRKGVDCRMSLTDLQEMILTKEISRPDSRLLRSPSIRRGKHRR